MKHELESEDIFFDKETDNYRITAWAPKDGHPTFSVLSKSSGLVLPNINMEYLIRRTYERKSFSSDSEVPGAYLIEATKDTLAKIAAEDDVNALNRYISSLLPIGDVDRHVELGSQSFEAGIVGSNVVPEPSIIRAISYSKGADIQKKLSDLMKNDRYARLLNIGYHQSDNSRIKDLRRKMNSSQLKAYEGEHSEDLLEFTDSLSDVLSYAMTRDAIEIDDNLKNLMSCLDSSNEVNDLDYTHPYNQALKDMVFGQSKEVSDEMIIESGLFGGKNSRRDNITSERLARFTPGIVAHHLATTHGTKGGVIHMVSGVSRDVKKRDLLQYYNAFHQNPSVFLGQGLLANERFMLTTTTSSPREVLLRELGKDIYPSLQSADKTKMGKKEFNIVISNMKALDELMRRSDGQVLHTLDGGKILLTRHEDPYVRSSVEVNIIREDGEKHGAEFIDSDNFARNQSNLAQIIASMPSKNLLKSEHLQSLSLVRGNMKLEKNMLEGIVRHRSGVDKKNTSTINTWKAMMHSIDKAMLSIGDTSSLPGDEKTYEISRLCDEFRNASVVNDYFRIVEKISEGVVASVLYGRNAISPVYESLEDYQENMESEDTTVVFEDDEISSGQIPVELSSSPKEFQGYSKLLKMSREAHTGYARLSKEIAPDTKLSWEKCTPDIEFMMNGRTYSIEHLDSYSKVVQHGLSMNHCVGSYAGMCMQGEYAAFVISCEGEEIGTIGMDYDGEEFEFDQMYGHSNSILDEELAEKVKLVFIDELEVEGQVNGRDIELHPSREENVSESELLSLQFGMDMDNDEVINKSLDFLLRFQSPEDVTHSLLSTLDSVYDKLHDLEEENLMYGYSMDYDEDDDNELEDSDPEIATIYKDLNAVRERLESLVNERVYAKEFLMSY